MGGGGGGAPGVGGGGRGGPGSAGRGHDRAPGPLNPGAAGPVVDSTSDKAAILEAVLDFYDEFARLNPPTEQLRFEAAKASRRVCEVHAWLKRPDKAEKALAAFRRAAVLLEALVVQHPEKPEWKLELAMVYAVAPVDAFSDPKEPLYRTLELCSGNAWVTGTTQIRLALLFEADGDRPGAETAYRAAVSAFQAAEPGTKPTPGHLELAYARYRLAVVLSQQGDWRGARQVLEESVASLHPPADQGEGRGRAERECLSQTYTALAAVCAETRDDKSAEWASKKASLYWVSPKEGGPGWQGGPGWGGMWGGKKGGPPKKDPKN